MLEEIPNFPQAFMDRHMNWHTFTPPDGRTVPEGQPGSGAEFLDFHHQFVSDVKSWYSAQPGADMSKLVAWNAFPNDLAAAHSPELADFQAYASNASNFTSEDALGIYVEHEHDFVHGYIATLYNTPLFGTFDSCKYFMFYQWHGMIDAWRGNWLVHHKRALKDLVDTGGGKFIRDKALVADINVKHLRDVIQKQIPEIPPKSPKELVEVPGRPQEGDPAIANLTDRLSQLEAVVHRQAFIRAKARPKVG
jgi:hypothetical protein